jgi:hypothetical protein
MKQARAVMLSLLMVLVCSLSSAAQQSATTATNATVPPLIPFSSVATDEGGSSLSGVVSITFSLDAGQQGGVPLWTETQNNIQLDATGHYSVQLGITQLNGVPTTMFTTGEARWLGVRIAEQVEQPRVLLLSVPYALKAGDAASTAAAASGQSAPLVEESPAHSSSASTPSSGPESKRGQHHASSNFLRYHSWHISEVNGTLSNSASSLHLTRHFGELVLRPSTNDLSGSQVGIPRMAFSVGVRGWSICL